MKTLQRFESYVSPEPNTGCWLWTGCLYPNGYAILHDSVNKKNVRAHRWAYEHFIGPFPIGLVSDHLCRQRSCVNPHHIEPVTSQENSRRGIGLRVPHVWSRTKCQFGHELVYSEISKRRRCAECQKLADSKRRAKSTAGRVTAGH